MGLVIKSIPAGSGHNYYVIDIPQAVANAPHQVTPNKKYYKRLNFTTTEMEDYEVRDAMRRLSNPNLYVHVDLNSFERDEAAQEVIAKLNITTRNESSEPASVAFLRFAVPMGTLVTAPTGIMAWVPGGTITAKNDVYLVFRKVIAPPNHLPLFKEEAFSHGEFEIRIPFNLDKLSYIVTVSCPGCLRTRMGHIEQFGKDLNLVHYENSPA